MEDDLDFAHGHRSLSEYSESPAAPSPDVRAGANASSVCVEGDWRETTLARAIRRATSSARGGDGSGGNRQARSENSNQRCARWNRGHEGAAAGARSECRQNGKHALTASITILIPTYN